MIGLNLHDVVADALEIVNPFKEMTFTRTAVEWSTDSFTPKKTETKITVKGKLQPASLQELRQTGFDLKNYQYFKVFLSFDATQLDDIRQIGSDEFVCEGLLYRIVAKEDWIQNGWREAYCYLVDTSEDEDDTGEDEEEDGADDEGI